VILAQHGYYQLPSSAKTTVDPQRTGRKVMGKHVGFDLDAFSKWLYMRQMPIEGGFQGRTNKLVDSCYSFWQGACFALLPMLDPGRFRPNCDAGRLLRYVVGACTHGSGGLKDKPGAHRDYYHTCYALSGLSVVLGNDPTPNMFGLKRTNPIYNVIEERMGLARAYFAKAPNTHLELLSL
jgi:protein farnesyltransferase subunit beta